jgi:hypothetical protein
MKRGTITNVTIPLMSWFSEDMKFTIQKFLGD